MSHAQLITFVIAMLAITNPIGNLAIFASLTGDKTLQEKRKTALVAGVAILIILIIVTWTGDLLLRAFGIDIASFETAGGLIIALMGISMLHAKPSPIHHGKQDQADAEAKTNVAVVPIAIPIVAGPGAITTIVVNTHHYSTIDDKLMISAVSVVIAIILWIAFYFSAPVSRLLGPSGVNIVTRIMGIILASIAFGMMASGFKALFPGLA
ncbi:MAG: MarC family protein [Thermodesulfobacteriota bacterium]